MNIKMLASMWLLSIMALFIFDTRTGALPLNELGPRRCYECNGTACEDPEGFADDETGKPVVVCPRDRPHCSTRAAAPNFISVLTCAPAADRPCVLNNPNKDTFEVICVCPTHLCNAPFAQEMREELFHLSNASLKGPLITSSFWRKGDHPTNSSEEHVYKVTNIAKPYTTGIPRSSTTLLTTLTSVFLNTTSARYDDYPRVEYLKHRTTVPSDDEEDDSEGSGLYEDPKYHAPSSVPAAPSSYLPEKENKAQPLILNILAAIPLLIYIYIV